jgi:hypothetical protein
MSGKQVVRDLYRRLRKVSALSTPMAVVDQVFRSHSFLRGSGWLESYRSRMPIAFGNPLPFYTYPSIAFLEQRVNRTLRVFEYGAGYSTLWWASRSMSVIACEHDRGWFDRMTAMIPANVQLIHQALVPGGDYSRQATAFVSDVIVVDGRDRVNCAKASVEGLSEGGVVVWDNSDRERYREGYDFLKDRGFRRLDFAGPGPIDYWPWMTSVFYRNDNCLGI